MRFRGSLLLARFVVVPVVVGVVVAACPAGASTSEAKPRTGGMLTVINGSDHGTGWDPIRLQGIPRLDETPMAYAMYDTLLYEDARSSQITGRLATSIEPSADF